MSQTAIASGTVTEKFPLPIQNAPSDTAEEEPRPRQWTRAEYYRAAEKGIFHPDERLELIRGEIFRMSPQLKLHVSGVYRSTDVFTAMVDKVTRHVRAQAPITLRNNTEPEPDVVVVQGHPSEFVKRDCTSKDVSLLLEVSDATVYFDRNRKAQIYAEDGITDYWLLNVRARQLEVRRDSQNGVYQTKTVYGETESVAPLFAPQTLVAVVDILPPVLVP